MPQLQGLIFDLDGTLLDSAPDLRQAVNKTLEHHGRRGLTLEEMQSMVGDGMLPMLTRAFAATGAPIPNAESFIRFQEFIGYYRGQPPDPSQLYPYTVETITDYHAAGVKLGIYTNKQQAATVQLLDGLGLSRFFTFVAGGDTFPVHKPHPDHVRGVIKELGVPAENCVMVGDGPHDVNASRGAGIPCLLITHGYGGDFSGLNAAGVIGGFKELPAALKALGFEAKT